MPDEGQHEPDGAKSPGRSQDEEPAVAKLVADRQRPGHRHSGDGRGQ